MRSISSLILALALFGCRQKDPVGGDTGFANDFDGDGFLLFEDCDDNDPTVNPDADEICDGIDNNCDDQVDEGVTTTFYADADADGFGDPGAAVSACEPISGTVVNDLDCDDNDANTYVGAASADSTTACMRDSDGDGYGDPSPPSGVTAGSDCDDDEPDANPGEDEVCDGIDNDCDALVDDDDTDVDTSAGQLYHADTDGDGFGDPGSTQQSCAQPSGYTSDDTDCDDSDAAINPDADEVCDSVDNDCDTLVDSDDDSLDTATQTAWYADTDGDGHGDPTDTTAACAQPSGYVEDADDCDDTDAAISPDADEICDSVDNDCDGDIDDDDASVDTSTGSTFYSDSDSDGFGDAASSTSACARPSGYVEDSDDCDDSDAAINPDADEVCDSVDNDCDGDIDDDDSSVDLSTSATYYADTDGDGFGDPADSTESCATPSGYVSDDTDCDDTDATISPAASEVCDAIDNDCDGDIDDDDSSVDTSTGSTFYADGDSDGYGDATSSTDACTQPSGYVEGADDCDDTDAAISPDADEVCDSLDNDCDGDIDDDDASVDLSTGSTFYADADSDGYGDPTDSTDACTEPSGYVEDADDCDDTDAAISPDADEVCDGIDNDCDTLVDDDDDDTDTSTGTTWYADTDSDGYGDPTDSTDACTQPSGYVEDSDDCDDTDAAISPDADEVCDSVDNDCDTLIDDDDSSVDTSTGATFYADTDSDGFGDAASSTDACTEPSGYVEDDDDCDDTDGTINPDADEVCDSVDNDCDGDIDDDDASVDTSTGSTFYADADSDGYGDATSSTDACTEPSGYISDDTDCDDTNVAINPAAAEVCDSVDNDCDGDIDDDDASVDLSTGSTFYGDDDGDSFGDATDSTDACAQPSGYVEDADDCDDTDAAINPDADEICDSVDNDCDGDIDDDDASVDTTTGATFYADTDSDGFGDVGDSTETCAQPSGYVSDDTDCDDSDAAINPDADEICDSVDNDCDGDVDDDDSSVDTSTGSTFYADDDSDGYGDSAASSDACAQPSGYVSDDTDCDDTDGAVNPAATEVCDAIDNDCDGDVDDDDSSVDPSSGATYYSDDDGDGYGDAADSIDTCSLPSGYVTNDEDCDDTDAAISPDADEICDTIDNDCDSLIDDADGSVDTSTGTTWYADDDSDGFGDPTDSTDACTQPASYVEDSDDCDDTDAAVNPDADEVCDSIDNDCDTLVDDDDSSVDTSTGSTYYDDSDSDGYGDPTDSTDACSQPSGHVGNSDDCDDTDGAISPDADEVCDSVDNDCDGDIDDDDANVDTSTGSTFYDDGDSDGYGDPADSTDACTQPSGHVSNSDDCDDTSASISPDADEICDTVDNDCDGDVDDDDSSVDLTTGSTYYDDDDSDGFGDAADSIDACTQPSGHVSNSDDCDDTDGAINPDADEVCDSIDNDCDTLIDDDDASVDTSTGSTFYDDGDSDGYGDPADSTDACTQPSGHVSNDEDCDDTDAAISPDADEVCDSVDNDCDTLIDDDDSSVDLTTGSTFYDDGDSDGYGDSADSTDACSQPSGHVSNSDDCDDTDGAVNPSASEVCDSVDNDCDGDTDDDDSSVDLSTGSTYYDDGDSDGYGDATDSTDACTQPSGHVSNSDDCDDTDGAISPDADEICDTIDNDCDGDVDDDDSSVDTSTGSTFYDDGDSDGFGDPADSTDACTQPSGHVSNDEDCDDADGAVNPDADEVCDSVDNDCDTLVDDDDSSVDLSTGSTFYDDGDSDGYGDAGDSIDACSQPSGHVSNSDDCDDTDSSVSPDADEICDTIDNDCDGDIDDDDPDVDTSTGGTFYDDNDGDGYGDPADVLEACNQPSSSAANDEDCDDTDAAISPDADEVCDSVDNDCDTLIDDDDSSVDLSTGSTYYDDGDSDGYGDAGDSTDACTQPSGHVSNSDDCDDTDGAINPDASEVCDSVDNDCDTLVDDDDSSVSGQPSWYADLDGDGYGDAGDTLQTCEQPSSYVSNDEDCDDTDGAVSPDAAEVCDSIDNDCDGDIDDDDSDVGTCYSGPTVADLVEGDLIITEIMANPSAVSDNYGEWLEVYNNSGDTVDLEDLVLTDDTSSHTVSSSVQVDAGGYVVFCINASSSANGGVTCDYDYSSLSFSNSGDEITLSYSGTTFDAVDFSTWSVTAGASLALSYPECSTTDDNDLEGLWCTSGTDTYGSGDYGSPGDENAEDCLSETTYGLTTATGNYGSSPGFSVAQRVTLSSDSYLLEFGANSLYGSYNDIKMALYAENGSGLPGDLVATAEQTTAASGATTLALETSDTCVIALEAGDYWIAFIGDYPSTYGHFICYDTSVPVTNAYRTQTFSSAWPDPYSADGTYSTYGYSVSIVVDE